MFNLPTLAIIVISLFIGWLIPMKPPGFLDFSDSACLSTKVKYNPNAKKRAKQNSRYNELLKQQREEDLRQSKELCERTGFCI